MDLGFSPPWLLSTLYTRRLRAFAVAAVVVALVAVLVVVVVVARMVVKGEGGMYVKRREGDAVGA